MYNYLKQRVKHAIRFRHKRGFGVHSPFVFDLITNVIKEKAMYYDFVRLESAYKQKSKERKLNRMLFRLANYLGFRHVLFLGATTRPVMEYLAAVSNGMTLWNGGPIASLGVVKDASAEWETEPLEFVYLGRALRAVWSPEWEALLRAKREEVRCVVITDIYKKQLNSQLWRQLRQEATVSIDMMWYGLLFFDPHLQQGRDNMII